MLITRILLAPVLGLVSGILSPVELSQSLLKKRQKTALMLISTLRKGGKRIQSEVS